MKNTSLKQKMHSFEIKLLLEILASIFLFLVVKALGEFSEILDVVLPVLLLVILVGYFIINYFISFSNFLRDHWSYFWPSFFYLFILGVFLASVDQVDTLFVDLFEGKKTSLILFIFFQFPCSILIVWYMPYYLFFSKSYYGAKQVQGAGDPQRYFLSEKITYYFHLVLPVKTLIAMSGKESEDTAMCGKEPEDFRLKKEKDVVFHQVRRLLGAFYIMALILLLGSILEKVGFSSAWKWGTLGGAWGMMIVFYWSLFRIENSKNQFIQVGEIKFDLRNSYTIPIIGIAVLMALSFLGIFQFSPRFNAYNITLILFFVTFFILLRRVNKKGESSSGKQAEENPGKKTAVRTYENKEEPNKRDSAYLKKHAIIIVSTIAILILYGIGWMIYILFSKEVNLWFNIKLYLIANLIFLFTFMGFGYYRRFTRRYEFPDSKFLNKFYSFLDNAVTPMMMLTNFLLFAVFIASLFGGLCHFSGIVADYADLLNPINIFFFSFNGLIAFIALMSRYFTLSQHYKKNKNGALEASEEEATAPADRRYLYAVMMILFAAGFYFYTTGRTNYHTLKYIKKEKENLFSLKQYTQQFLSGRDTTKPIILIASDGGGLKGAYWTLLVLQELEKKGKLNFKDDVFLTSGASGGSIGLGMYTYLKAQPAFNNDPTLLSSTINKIGRTNFLSTDFIGALTRWPLKGIPNDSIQNLPDRMDVMAENYFEISDTAAAWKYNEIKKSPFAHIWIKNNYKLPIYIANTAQMEYGMKGISHPLLPNTALTKGYIDLTCKKDDEEEYISFPDALFTTNRFPLLSPMAKVEGHGHFFDAGALDNSGIGTILHFLQYMKASQEKDTIYKEFFKRGIELISIRCAKSRYIFDHFQDYHEEIPLTKSISGIQAILSAVSNDGLTGTPRFYDKLLDDTTWREDLYSIRKFKKISIPFHIGDEHEVYSVLGGHIEDEGTQQKIRDEIDTLNTKITRAYKIDDPGERPKVLDPPLGRMISKTSRGYMKKMVELITE